MGYLPARRTKARLPNSAGQLNADQLTAAASDE
jgi:hypothetical protein